MTREVQGFEFGRALSQPLLICTLLADARRRSATCAINDHPGHRFLPSAVPRVKGTSRLPVHAASGATGLSSNRRSRRRESQLAHGLAAAAKKLYRCGVDECRVNARRYGGCRCVLGRIPSCWSRREMASCGRLGPDCLDHVLRTPGRRIHSGYGHQPTPHHLLHARWDCPHCRDGRMLEGVQDGRKLGLRRAF